MILLPSDAPFDRTGELALHSRSYNQIINAPAPEIDPAERLRLSNIRVQKWASVRLRRHRGFYNCWGLALASRRTWLEDDMYRVLREDGYRRIDRDELRVGDLVLYSLLGDLQHVAVVVDLTLTGEVHVISQWGQVGEFTHRIDEVDEWLGVPAEYWTEREP